MNNDLLAIHAKSFHWASFFLSKETYNKCSSLYNFCRTLDDIADDNSDLEIKKKIIIKNYFKDHRVFMTSVIASLSFGGEWHIYDKDSIKTSFPNFLKIINELKN